MMQTSQKAEHKMAVSPVLWHFDDCHLQTQCPRDLIKSAGQWDTLKPERSCSAKESRL